MAFMSLCSPNDGIVMLCVLYRNYRRGKANVLGVSKIYSSFLRLVSTSVGGLAGA
jgi:hypothetical protein